MVDGTQHLLVRSHVARDLLQNAALFKTDKLVVWEYVSNGLEYVDPVVNPVVRVELDSRSKRITVQDNGRGMDWAGLENFFLMHGENVDRKLGRPGRGRFGTGKSAAFGIADVLRVTSVRNGRCSKVELRRKDIEAHNGEGPIPVNVLERDKPVSEPNGTVVEIESIHLQALDQPAIIRYIERQIARWPRNVTVIVNGQVCSVQEPAACREYIFKPTGSLLQRLGDVQLVVKVSKTPLDEEQRGIAVYSKGVLHETTLGGNENREMSQYIFGLLDVPALDDDRSPIPAFDLSRSMRLNPNNELVQSIHAFIGQKVDEVRRELVEEEKKRRRSEEARTLARRADEIARVINQDFQEFLERVARIRSLGHGVPERTGQQARSGSDQRDLVIGGDLPAQVIASTGGLGASGEGGNRGGTPRSINPEVAPGDANSEVRGRPAGGRGNRFGVSTGGFRVEFQRMGPEERRAHCLTDSRVIYVNLDHPQIVAAREGNNINDPGFLRLVTEVAFTEYAIALAQELASRGEFIDFTDPAVHIRETLNRVARRGAALYS